jgi:hypothetical protein
MRRRVAMFINAGMRTDVPTDKNFLRNGNYNARMLALRYVYILALVVWLGGMVILGALVAPLTFDVLQMRVPDGGRELAGAVFGATIAAFHCVAYGAGALLLLTLGMMRILGPRPAAFGIRAAIVVVMLAIAAYSGFVVLERIDALQAAAGGLASALPASDGRRIEFDRLHLLSTRLMMLNLAGALVLLYWEAKER